MGVIKATFTVAVICSLIVAIPVAGIILGIILAIVILSKSSDKGEGEK